MVSGERGRYALTHYEVLETCPACREPIASLVRCELETGRTHQIRVHMAHIGHPLLGDATYGSGFKTKAQPSSAEAQQAALPLSAGRRCTLRSSASSIRAAANSCVSRAIFPPIWQRFCWRLRQPSFSVNRPQNAARAGTHASAGAFTTS